jgi:type VI secretion system protein VasJ
MAIDFEALLLPISSESPGGVESRETPQYELVFSEIECLTSLSADRQPDWLKVEAQSTELLKTVSKDFMVASWLSAAWVEKSGVDGLSAGLGLFAGLLKTYWQTGFPSLKRMRGRRNALIWWTDRVKAWLSNATLAPLSLEVHTQLVERIEEIDHIFAEVDPEAPSLNELVNLIKRLDVVEPIVTPAAQDAETQASAASGIGGQSSIAKNVTSSASTSSATTPSASTIATFAPSVTGAQYNDLSKVANTDDFVTALSPVLSYLGNASQKLVELNPYSPLAIGLNRIGARSALLSLPQAQGQVTLIAPPPLAEVQSFNAVCDAGNPQGIASFCEGRLATYPFWLDLDRQSALAYGSLGPVAATMQSAVVDEVLAFVKRLPGIERLTFSDGKPFADEATKAWIATCQAERLGSGNTDKFSEVNKQANECVGSGDSEAGVAVLQAFISNTRSGRDQFRARIALVELALNLKKDMDVEPLIDPLLDECERLNLTYWEPALALLAWSLKLRVARAVGKLLEGTSDLEKIAANQSVIKLALKKVSMLDFGEALRQV